MGILQGDDGEANHAITIFNKWIFDANEKHAIPLCQEGLNYCVSTSETRVTFLGFTEGFFFCENSKKQRLKRKAEGVLQQKFSKRVSNAYER